MLHEYCSSSLSEDDAAFTIEDMITNRTETPTEKSLRPETQSYSHVTCAKYLFNFHTFQFANRWMSLGLASTTATSRAPVIGQLPQKLQQIFAGKLSL